MIFKKRELSPEQRDKMRKIQIALDVIAIVLLLSALLYGLINVREIKDAHYDFCYLCEQRNEDTYCYRRGQVIIWEGEDFETKFSNSGFSQQE